MQIVIRVKQIGPCQISVVKLRKHLRLITLPEQYLRRANVPICQHNQIVGRNAAMKPSRQCPLETQSTNPADHLRQLRLGTVWQWLHDTSLGVYTPSLYES